MKPKLWKPDARTYARYCNVRDITSMWSKCSSVSYLRPFGPALSTNAFITGLLTLVSVSILYAAKIFRLCIQRHQDQSPFAEGDRKGDIAVNIARSVIVIALAVFVWPVWFDSISEQCFDKSKTTFSIISLIFITGIWVLGECISAVIMYEIFQEKPFESDSKGIIEANGTLVKNEMTKRGLTRMTIMLNKPNNSLLPQYNTGKRARFEA